jgi:glycogen operon protein
MITDDSYLLMLHSGDNAATFRLPGPPWAAAYEVVIDTTRIGGVPDRDTAHMAAGVELPVGPRTSLLLRVKRD